MIGPLPFESCGRRPASLIVAMAGAGLLLRRRHDDIAVT
jgi:hypothetical protein